MKNFTAFTTTGKGLLCVLRSKITIIADKKINPNGLSKTYDYGTWDTGATNTAISDRIAKELNLTPTGKIKIGTANGEKIVNKYIIDIILPNNLCIKNVEVSGVDLTADTDILIGMDIITKGDFSVTSVNGNTTFSYRFPSCEIIDYCADASKLNKKAVERQQKELEAQLKQHGNEKCFCGSGKKYRYCHGKEEMKKIKKQKELVH